MRHQNKLVPGVSLLNSPCMTLGMYRGTRVLACFSAIIICLHIIAAERTPSPSRPKILFIMADDHAAHALSSYGSKINQTPNLDRLAKEGMRFNNCFAVNAICTPSRASI